MKIDFHKLGTVKNESLKYAVIITTYMGNLVYVRHKERETWEIPGGHREDGESINDAGTRELIEETGAKEFEIRPICEYSVTRDSKASYGRLFYSEVFVFGELPDLEIRELKIFDESPTNLTYPHIQPVLLGKVLEIMGLTKEK